MCKGQHSKLGLNCGAYMSCNILLIGCMICINKPNMKTFTRFGGVEACTTLVFNIIKQVLKVVNFGKIEILVTQHTNFLGGHENCIRR